MMGDTTEATVVLMREDDDRFTLSVSTSADGLEVVLTALMRGGVLSVDTVAELVSGPRP